MRTGKFSAIIAVREGSKRVENKNIRNFCGSSLLEIKVRQALGCELLDEVIVSSDSDDMLEASRILGASVHKREERYCADDSPMNEVYERLAKLAKNDHIVYLHVTSPLLSSDSLHNSIETYRNLGPEYDSLATVEKLNKYIWFDGSPINYDPSNHPRSQDLPRYYALNFAVNIIEKKQMIKRKNIVGNHFYPFFLNDLESVDIDTQHDFDVATFLYKR